jgi:hypothetical protein
LDQIAHHAALFQVWLAQHRVQGGDDGHPQFVQQRQHMAAGKSAENAKFVLQANHIHIGDVQKIRRPQVRRQVLLGNLETHFRRIIVSIREVIDRHNETLHRREFRRHGAAQIRCERGDATFARQIIAEKSNFTNAGDGLHESLVVARADLPMRTILIMRHASAFTKNRFRQFR